MRALRSAPAPAEFAALHARLAEHRPMLREIALEVKRL
jgi:hypothetical protein